MRRKKRDRVPDVVNLVVDGLEKGLWTPALATVFFHRKVEVPSRHWSWTNRVIAALNGHALAAGFRQWQELGRSVKAKEKAFYILAPRTVTVEIEEEEDETEQRVVGFVAKDVFGYDQTGGEEIEFIPEGIDERCLEGVSREWDVSTTGTEEEWVRALVGVADRRLQDGSLEGGLNVVSRLGGRVLLSLLGEERRTGDGDCYGYVMETALLRDKRPALICYDLIDRTARAVDHLLGKAEGQVVL